MNVSSLSPCTERDGANPTVMVFEEPNACAAYIGRHPIFAAASLTLRLVSADTPGRSLIAKETAVWEIPNSSAISLRLTRCILEVAPLEVDFMTFLHSVKLDIEHRTSGMAYSYNSVTSMN